MLHPPGQTTNSPTKGMNRTMMSPCMTTASTIEQRQSTEPTLRSMPPVMMTIVIPSATIATKVALRVML